MSLGGQKGGLFCAPRRINPRTEPSVGFLGCSAPFLSLIKKAVGPKTAHKKRGLKNGQRPSGYQVLFSGGHSTRMLPTWDLKNVPSPLTLWLGLMRKNYGGTKKPNQTLAIFREGLALFFLAIGGQRPFLGLFFYPLSRATT